MPSKIFKAFLAVIVFRLLPSASAAAEKPHVRADLVSEASSIRPGEPFWAAVRLRHDEGWHTYWKNPGDSGIPTRVEWRLPPDFSAGPLVWPVPEKIRAFGLASFGYGGETWLLTEFKAPPNFSGDKALLWAEVKWLECADICIPGKEEVSLSLLVSSRPALPDPRSAQAWARARARIPLSETGWTASARRENGKILLQLSPPSWLAEPMKTAAFFPDVPAMIEESAEQDFAASGSGYRLELTPSPLSTGTLKNLTGVLSSPEGWRGPGSETGWEVRIPVSEGPASAPLGLWMALLFAFMGGLLLNLMPCVLPVLSLKILGFVRQAGGEKREMRLHGLLFSAGVIVSFWVLAGLLLALRAGGSRLGWGFQLQSPVFIGALCVLFLALALNLLGFFEIGSSLVGLGAVTSGREGKAATFLNGVLATVVATPCTAPFMGTALGYALVQPASTAFLTFTFLGAGMAFPYALLSFTPALLKFVPRPGPWMERLKKVLGLLLLGTFAWLAWVLARQLAAKDASSPRQARAAEEAWEAYDENRVRQLRSAGTPLFIDFTAAWCLTCQVNERVVLSQKSVLRKFKEKGVVLMKADWTSYDPAVTRALQEIGRSSVPVYVLSGKDPGAAPKVLPPLLTPGIVLETLEKI